MLMRVYISTDLVIKVSFEPVGIQHCQARVGALLPAKLEMKGPIWWRLRRKILGVDDVASFYRNTINRHACYLVYLNSWLLQRLTH